MYNDKLKTIAEELEMEWDEAKRQSNFEKHGLDFFIADEIFKKTTLVREDRRKVYGERRFIALGQIKGRPVTLVYTHRVNKIRIISLRKSHEKEASTYRKHERSHRLGTG